MIWTGQDWSLFGNQGMSCTLFFFRSMAHEWLHKSQPTMGLRCVSNGCLSKRIAFTARYQPQLPLHSHMPNG